MQDEPMITGSEAVATPAASPGRWSERYPARAAGAYAAVYLAAAYAGGALALLHLPRPALAVLVTVVGTGATALSLLLVLSVCRVRLPLRAEAALLFPVTLIFLLARPEVTVPLVLRLGMPPKVLLAMGRLFIWPSRDLQDLVGNVALILWAVLIGRMVSRIIREGKLLLPVAVIASLVDIFTVFWGFVGHAAEKAPHVVQALSAQAPAVEVAKQVNAPILTYIGIGDFLFIAMFLSVALRYALPASRAMWAAFVSMLVAALVLTIFAPPGIPGLPFISVAVLLVTRRYFTFTAEEKRALVVAGAIVLAIAALIAGRLLVRGQGPGARGQEKTAAVERGSAERGAKRPGQRGLARREPAGGDNAKSQRRATGAARGRVGR